MNRVLRGILWACITLSVLEFFPACTGTLVLRPARPPVVVEVRPAPPHRDTVWVDGHWRWAGNRKGWVWSPGHYVTQRAKHKSNRK